MNITDTLIMPREESAPKRVAGYELLREIGRGGMSVVYEARDPRTGQCVALKLLTLPPSLTLKQQGDLIARFAREARAVARLSHPNIVFIREVGEREGEHFLAMECLTGLTLRERLMQGPLTLAEATPILTQIAGALDAVHAAGIVHRDVKPSNVMLLADGTAKLLDFGIARQNDDTTITNTGMIVGSPAYMSPEQVMGETGTAASDVWSLGVLAYEMLAGQPPFTGNTIPAVLYQVTHQTPPPVPGLSSPLQKVLRCALDRNPARRYPSARAFAEAMQAAQETRPAPGAAQFLSSLRPPQWPRAVWLLPLLIGLLCIPGGVMLRHRLLSSGGGNAAVALPMAAPPPPAESQSKPQTAAAVAPPPTHTPLKIAHKALVVHHTPPRRPKIALQRSRTHRRFPRLTIHRVPRHLVPRPAGRRSGDSYDADAAARLQKFIWPEGR